MCYYIGLLVDETKAIQFLYKHGFLKDLECEACPDNAKMIFKCKSKAGLFLQCPKATRRVGRCTASSALFKLTFREVNDFTPGEIIFLFLFGFP